MPIEPERQIEKLLRACAQKRREQAGAPFELHPATRRLLQGEVIRELGGQSAASGSWWQNWRLLWPRLGWGLGIFAVLALGAWFWLGPMNTARHEISLAKMEPRRETQLANAPVMPAAAPAETREKADRRLDSSLAKGELAQDKTAEALFKDRKQEFSKERQFGTVGGAQPAGTAGTAPAETPAPAALEQKQAGEIAASGTLTRSFGEPLGGQLKKGPAQEPLRSQKVEDSPAASLVADAMQTPAAPSTAAAPTPPAPDLDTTLTLAESTPSKSAVQFLDKNKHQFASIDGADRDASGLLASSVLASNRNALVPGLADVSGQSGKRGIVQRFARVQPEIKAKAVASEGPSVLVSFRVEQAGQELRVVDSDGSVYTGFLVASNSPAQLGLPAEARVFGTSGQRRESASRRAGSGPAEQNYPFFLLGTNRSLNQRVVFHGNLTGVTNAIPYARWKIGTEPDTKMRLTPLQPGPMPLLNSRISGKLIIGEGKPLDIQATPAP